MVMEILLIANFIVVTISQYIHVSKHHTVHLENTLCYMSIIPQ